MTEYMTGDRKPLKDEVFTICVLEGETGALPSSRQNWTGAFKKNPTQPMCTQYGDIKLSLAAFNRNQGRC